MAKKIKILKEDKLWYVATVQEQIKKTQSALDSKEWDTVQKNLCAFWGSGSYFGFNLLSEMAEKAFQAAKEEDSKTTLQYLSKLSECVSH